MSDPFSAKTWLLHLSDCLTENWKNEKRDILSLRQTYDIVELQLFANNARLVQVLQLWRNEGGADTKKCRLLNRIPPAGREKQQDTPLFNRRHLVRGKAPKTPEKIRLNAQSKCSKINLLFNSFTGGVYGRWIPLPHMFNNFKSQPPEKAFLIF